MLNKRYIRYIDLWCIGIIIAISALSLSAIFSATYRPEVPYSIFLKKQLFGIITGFILYGLAALIDYRAFCRWGFYCFFISLGLLLFTLFKGSIGMGAQRWINLGLFKIQPSELMKLFFPACMSHLLFVSDQDEHTLDYWALAKILGLLVITVLLVLKQPDLGTAIILFTMSLLLLWLAGVPTIFFIALLGIMIGGLPISWRHLHEYQKKRVLVFLGYDTSPSANYQLEQSKIAIGSGGLTGKGFLQGTQNKLMFLPEGRTDFILAVVGEEFGLLGTLGLMALYVMLFAKIIYSLYSVKTMLGRMLGLGLIMPLLLCVIINSGMVLGLLPIVGIPLPLMSYGICHTWITFLSLGVIQSICIRRFYH